MPTQSILKWGNSLAVRIPAAIAKQMQIGEDAEVEIRLEGQQLIIEKSQEALVFTHQTLVKALRKRKKGGGNDETRANHDHSHQLRSDRVLSRCAAWRKRRQHIISYFAPIIFSGRTSFVNSASVR